MKWAAPVFRILVWLAYPLTIYYGLQFAAPRYVALVLIAALLLRRRHAAAQFLTDITRFDLAVLGSLLLLAGMTALTDSELLLRFYPAAVNFGMLLLFGMTLNHPPSMIERFARLSSPDLPSAAVAYTRRVTWLWCCFFVTNGSAAVVTAIYASRDTWALYNGFIAYLLMGALFAGEWLVRRFVLARDGI